MPSRRKPAAGRATGEEKIPAEPAPQALGADGADEGDEPTTTVVSEDRERWIEAGPSSIGEKLVDTTLLHERFGDVVNELVFDGLCRICLLYTSPSPRDAHESRMPSSA